MLDIAYIRENIKAVKEACKNKNIPVDIDKLLKLDEERRKLIANADHWRAKRNEQVHKSAGKEPPASVKQTVAKAKIEIEKFESKLKEADTKLVSMLVKVPNLHSKDTPVGKDETANKVLRKVGKPKRFDFKPKAHWQLGPELDLIDIERAAKVSGARFSYLKNGAAKMQFALISWVMDILTDPKEFNKIIKKAKLNVAATPFIPVVAPALIRKNIFSKTGRLHPIADKYYLKDDELFLSGSAEHALAPLHAGETLNYKDLPLRYLGFSTAFRREAGSYGKDVRGILRQHQFDKLEMESFSTVEQGPKEQDLMVAIAEYIVGELELPYQVVAISTGDMGKPDYRQIDIETWMAFEGKFRETHTADYVTDYQARALDIKYQDKEGKKFLAHMNDATAIAVGRMLIAIIDNYQTKDGKVEVPKILQSYMGGARYL